MPLMKKVYGLTRRHLLGGVGAGFALSLLPRAAHAADDLDDLIREQMAAAQIPGLAVGLARDGEVAFARSYGFADLEQRRPVTPDTMFHIASITKTVTATAVMMLVDAGRIELDQRVAPYLDFTIAGEQAAAITFRHLLMHTAGISEEVYYQTDFRTHGADAALTIDQLLRDYLAPGGRYTGTGNVKTVPGTHWAYSNIGYGLLGYLAGRIAGQDMRVFTRDHIFRPLGMRHTAWTIADTPADLAVTPYDLVDQAVEPVPPVGFPDWSAGMMRASIRDLTQFVAMAANGGVAGDVRVLSSAHAAEMLMMQTPEGLSPWLSGQGLAWQQSSLGGVPRANHWGGDPGVFTMAYLDPARRKGVVLLSNLSATRESREALKSITARIIEAN